MHVVASRPCLLAAHRHHPLQWFANVQRPLCKTRSSEMSQTPGDGPSTTNGKYDPKAAAGFLAPEGERNLWWVEQFEERRRQEALKQQPEAKQPPDVPQPAAATVQQVGSTSSPPEGSSEAEPAAGPVPSTPQPLTRELKLKAALQLGQLSLVLAALILYPAASQPAGLYEIRVWGLYAVYWIFFALGSIRRLLKFGDLAPRSQDKQQSNWRDRMSLVLFIVMVVMLHWAPIARYTGLGLYFADLTLYELAGIPCLAAALWLNNQAAQALGAAWDRVIAPKELVTTGIYKHIQHPIYTSYMLLFFGYAMMLHSAPSALMLVLVCVLHYRRRTALEAEVLRAAFGKRYDDYAGATKQFLPGLV